MDPAQRETAQFHGSWLQKWSGDDLRMGTRRCGERGCHWCDYQLRNRHRGKLKRVEEVVSKCRPSYRFVTRTLPGDFYPDIREAPLEEQWQTFRTAMKRFRDRHRDKRSKDPLSLGSWTSSYVLEYTRNTTTGDWHMHSHDIWEVPPDFDDEFKPRVGHYSKQWLECIDKEQTDFLLEERNLSVFDVASNVFQVDRITKDGLAEYVTKAGRYMSKGGTALDDSSALEVSRVARGRHVFGTTGDWRGTALGRI